MMPVPLSLLALHFVGDFVLQTDWMALNKSRHLDALTLHVAVYTSVFAGWLYFPVPSVPDAVNISQFLVFTFLSHLLTDAITSRMTARLWFIDASGALVPGRRHWFFVTIGADQLIHAATLAFAAQRWL